MTPRVKAAVAGAGTGVVLLFLTWLVAFHTGLGQHADRSIFDGFAGFQRPRVNRLAGAIAGSCDPKPFVGLGAVLVLAALVRRRPRLALATAAILLGATTTTELLKPLLAEPRTLAGQPVAQASWPSGHATAAMSLALGAVLVTPARLRPAVAALGAAFAVAVSYSFLTLGWHYPSDVLGGFLVAGTWALLVVGVLSTLEARGAREPSTTGQRVSLGAALGPPLGALVGAGVLAGLVALARPHQVIVYARAHEAFIVGASAIAALGLVVATAVMLNVRR